MVHGHFSEVKLTHVRNALPNENYPTHTSLIRLPTFSRCSLSHKECNSENSRMRLLENGDERGKEKDIYIAESESAEFRQLAWEQSSAYCTRLRETKKNESDESFPVVPTDSLVQHSFCLMFNTIQTAFCPYLLHLAALYQN